MLSTRRVSNLHVWTPPLGKTMFRTHAESQLTFFSPPSRGVWRGYVENLSWTGVKHVKLQVGSIWFGLLPPWADRLRTAFNMFSCLFPRLSRMSMDEPSKKKHSWNHMRYPWGLMQYPCFSPFCSPSFWEDSDGMTRSSGLKPQPMHASISHVYIYIYILVGGFNPSEY